MKRPPSEGLTADLRVRADSGRTALEERIMVVAQHIRVSVASLAAGIQGKRCGLR